MKKIFEYCQKDSVLYIYFHGKYRLKRGRRPVATTATEKNPIKALRLAEKIFQEHKDMICDKIEFRDHDIVEALCDSMYQLGFHLVDPSRSRQESLKNLMISLIPLFSVKYEERDDSSSSGI